MKYTKMHGIGNDYLFVYGPVPKDIVKICKKASNRKKGIGSDGMIFISLSETADFSMRVFNADGSEAKMCGNGIRCVGKFVYDKGYTDKTNLTVETLSGIKALVLHTEDGKVKTVSVDMGNAEIGEETPDGVSFTPVNIGNPHAVIFCDDAEKAEVEAVGSILEKKYDLNVEFISKLSENTLRMRVWERGSGITKACGTGACASAAAAVKKGICSAEKPVRVILDGGELMINVLSDRIIMTGEAETVFEGEI